MIGQVKFAVESIAQEIPDEPDRKITFVSQANQLIQESVSPMIV